MPTSYTSGNNSGNIIATNELDQLNKRLDQSNKTTSFPSCFHTTTASSSLQKTKSVQRANASILQEISR